MKLDTNFQYYYNKDAKILDVILHGISQGIDSQFIQKLFNNSKSSGNSVITFNLPYLQRGEEKSSGPKLLEEQRALAKILKFCNFDNYSTVRLIGKSLGGIVSSYYVSKNNFKQFSVAIFGYIKGDVDFGKFNGQITIIQGEKDKFGGISVVKNDEKVSKKTNVTYIEIPGADHSYRDPDTKEPIFEDVAIKEFSKTTSS